MSEIKSDVFTRMEQMHHILSGFKVIFTNSIVIDVEEARRTCGGAGYQSNSGFTSLHAMMSGSTTAEGDNTVMLGQASRYLVKLFERA